MVQSQQEAADSRQKLNDLVTKMKAFVAKQRDLQVRIVAKHHEEFSYNFVLFAVCHRISLFRPRRILTRLSKKKLSCCDGTIATSVEALHCHCHRVSLVVAAAHPQTVRSQTPTNRFCSIYEISCLSRSSVLRHWNWRPVSAATSLRRCWMHPWCCKQTTVV